jgi:SiaC family regulatory phosphoprotein
MDNFSIKGSTYIPTVNFDKDTGVMEMSGESYHEYTIEFFQPILAWLHEYLQEPSKNIVFNFKMTYFNTSSSRRFLEIFDMLEDYSKNKSGVVKINWFYKEGDVDMLESGEEYAEDVDLDFEFIPYQ